MIEAPHFGGLSMLHTIQARARLATIVVGSAVSLLTARIARAQDYIEVDVMTPQACPSTISPSGYFQNVWFSSVRMMKMSGSGNVGSYENIDAAPVSSNGKWMWENGGGTFTCSRQYLIFGLYIDYQTLVPPSYGFMSPAGDDTSLDGSGDDGSYDDEGSWYAGGSADDCEDVEVYDGNGDDLGIGNTCDLFAE